MNMLVSIDPGLHATGVAIWGWPAAGPVLLHAFLVKHGDEPEGQNWVGMASAIWAEVELWIGGTRPVSTVVIEKPQVYVASRSKGDPNDLITIAAVVGAVVMRAWWGHPLHRPALVVYKPAEWKGQVPKPKPGETYIIEERVRAKLSEEERARVALPTAKSLHHNVFDAVGLGLHHLRAARR